MTAEDIRKALRKKFSDNRRYAIAEEVGLSTGFSHRRIDMIVVDCFESNGFRIDGIEIKVSTSDLRRELEDPEKHVSFFDKIDYFTLAAPKDVVMPLIDIIPKKWGILFIEEDGSARYKRKPLALEDKHNEEISRGFMAELVRAIQLREPSKAEINEAYQRGLTEGKEYEQKHRAYESDRIKREADKLEAYDKMQVRFRLWRDENIDDVLDEFEAFRKLDTDFLKDNIDRTIERLLDFKKGVLAEKENGPNKK